MLRSYDKHFIGGAWRPSTGTGVIVVVNPATEQVIGRVSAGTAEDANAAIKSARSAFPDWAQTGLRQRTRYVELLCEALTGRAAELAEVIMAEVGTPWSLAEPVQVGLPITEARCLIAVAAEFPWEERVANSIVVHEPIGVAAAITPWNFPLIQIMGKICLALLAGCTTVAKPSEVTPLSTMVLAEILDSIGLPAGVVNVVTRTEAEVGEALARHPDVDMVSLTGSARAGRRVAELASASLKKATLEHGGKSAMVMLADAEVEWTVESTLMFTYMNSGQTCTALTRLLVPRDRLPEVEEAVMRHSADLALGPPDSAANLGPLVSDVQLRWVPEYIERGIAEGARLLFDGRNSVPGNLGYYLGPTVFTDVKPSMAIEQEEIFGPVLSIIGYDTEEEAIEIANDTPYGLAAAVSSSDPTYAQAVARRLRAGQIVVNGSEYNPLAPFGATVSPASDGRTAATRLEEFLELKSIQL
jgi:aldehyde dehydrogenase (NAD+)